MMEPKWHKLDERYHLALLHTKIGVTCYVPRSESGKTALCVFRIVHAEPYPEDNNRFTFTTLDQMEQLTQNDETKIKDFALAWAADELRTMADMFQWGITDEVMKRAIEKRR